MFEKVNTIHLLLAVVATLVTFTVTAGERPAGVSQKIVNVSALEASSGDKFTAVMVELDPGVSVPTHNHAGFVFVYVLAGTIRSQLNNGEVVEFTTGQSWTEPPGTVHSFSHNPSMTNKVKLLAVFIAKDGSKLTNFEVKH